MKEYILNLEFDNWFNQLWFMNLDNKETKEKWNNGIREIKNIKSESKNEMEFQDNVILYLKKLGFIRIQK